jgi:hypothetical protein
MFNPWLALVVTALVLIGLYIIGLVRRALLRQSVIRQLRAGMGQPATMAAHQAAQRAWKKTFAENRRRQCRARRQAWMNIAAIIKALELADGKMTLEQALPGVNRRLRSGCVPNVENGTWQPIMIVRHSERPEESVENRTIVEKNPDGFRDGPTYWIKVYWFDEQEPLVTYGLRLQPIN